MMGCLSCQIPSRSTIIRLDDRMWQDGERVRRPERMGRGSLAISCGPTPPSGEVVVPLPSLLARAACCLNCCLFADCQAHRQHGRGIFSLFASVCLYFASSRPCCMSMASLAITEGLSREGGCASPGTAREILRSRLATRRSPL